MSNSDNVFARFSGSNVEHRLIVGTKTTVCGRDATLANRYPVLTVANSTDRRVYNRCDKCAN